MSPRLRPSRFHASGGTLLADVCHEISLDVAQHLLMKWWTQAREYQRMGDFRRAAEVRRQADDLQAAKTLAEQQRSYAEQSQRCMMSSYVSPSEVVRGMLERSVEALGLTP